MKPNVFTLITLLAVLAGSAACSELPDSYSAEAIEAWVVDAETKKPLDGVIVVVHWQLLSGMEGSTPVGQVEILETITDKDGRFRFPAWGPKPRKKGYLRGEDPQILLFKPAYEHRMLHNTVRSKINYSPVRRSEWNGKTIELTPFRGTPEEYARHLSFLNTSLYSVTVHGRDCEWTKVPRMLAAIFQQERIFSANSVPNSLMTVESLPKNDCGLPDEFFRGNVQ